MPPDWPGAFYHLPYFCRINSISTHAPEPFGFSSHARCVFRLIRVILPETVPHFGLATVTSSPKSGKATT